MSGSMGPSGKNNGVSWQLALIGGLLAGVCILGALLFLHLNHEGPGPETVVAKPAVKAVPKPPVKGKNGRIAIVLDDWGFNRTHCKQIQEFPAPVTVAILPELPYSKDVLQCTRACGKEAIIHLPLEPYVDRDKYPRGYIISTEMSQPEALKILRRYLDELPGVSGVNNHMGSKATEDPKLMTTIMEELKKHGLFFLDSMTSGNSICGDVAARIRIPFTRRSVFLDNRNDRASIEYQFSRAAAIARTKGSALVIGHDRALTLQIVAEQIRKLRAQGFEIISVRDFIKAARP